MRTINTIMCLILLSGLLTACDPFCNEDVYSIESDCKEPDYTSEILQLADFNSGEDPTNLCGWTYAWSSPENRVLINKEYTLDGGQGINNTYFLKVEIEGNLLRQGDTSNYIGAGMVCRLIDSPLGVNLNLYDYLEFDFRMGANSNLEFLRIKLEDTTERSTPERELKGLGVLSESWGHFKIPLDTLCNREWFDSPEIFSVERESVLRLVTVSIHDGTIAVAADGTFFIDNIFLSKD